ncbi:MAG: stage V sporulation protein D [Clostridiales bacterium]|nr:stage V sporulation protein D [Clostridiales bacterium]
MAGLSVKMRKKITVVLVFMFVMFFAVLFKLGYVQIVQGAELRVKAENDHTRDIVVAAKRGEISDRNGKTLAVSITSDSVSANPVQVKNSGKSQEIAGFLAHILDMDEETVLKKITANSSYVWVKRKIDFETAVIIRQQNLPGIRIESETKRSYPKGMLAAHILGFAGIDNQGLEGLEKARDDDLKGISGSISGEFDAKGQPIPFGQQVYVQPQNGYNMVLTIDENIQYFCERELDQLLNGEAPPKRASILIMNPKTGEILAMANRPAYDPNNYNDFEQALYRNALVTDVYEPGSTFKIITTSTALQEGVVSLEEGFYDPGYITVGKHRIKCWRSYNPHGSQSFAEVVQNSCNPGFVEVGLRIENKKKGLFYEYIRNFGFGQPTGIELYGEGKGLMIKEEKLMNIDIATMSIGQSIAVTPLQMVAAVSAVANGGTLLKPQIVREIRDDDNNVVQAFAPQEVRRVITEETAATVRDVLERVVTKGTGSRAYIPGMRVAGKTGTAQKAEGGRYAEGKYVASFIGLAPANDPQIVALVIIDEPGGYPYQGGQVAAPVFQVIVSDVLRYLGVVPQSTGDLRQDVEEDGTVKEIVVPDVVNLSLADAEKALLLCGLEAQISGNGSVVNSQVPAGLSRVKAGTAVLLNAGSSTVSNGVITVPDLTGKRQKEVAELLGAMGLKLSSNGSGGIANEQDPLPGVQVMPGQSVQVNFIDPEAEKALAIIDQ